MSVLNWIKTHKTAQFLIAGYVFAMFSLLPLALTDKQAGVESVVLWLPILAIVYLVPFMAAVICWSLWKRIAKPSLTVRHENLCLLAVWLFVTPIFADVMFYLPFEPGTAVQQHFTMRFLAPLFAGIPFSPVVTMLGALAGTAAYKVSARWSGRPAMQVLLTIVVACLEFIGLAAVKVFAGMVGVMVVFAALALAVLGTSIKRYQNRQEQTWGVSTTAK